MIPRVLVLPPSKVDVHRHAVEPQHIESAGGVQSPEPHTSTRCLWLLWRLRSLGWLLRLGSLLLG